MRALAVAALVALLLAPAAHAQEVWHAARTLMPGDVLAEGDVTPRALPRPLAGTLPADRNIVGMEMRRRVIANHPLTDRDLGQRLVVHANAPVRVLWGGGALVLAMDGRALESGTVGESIRVLNTATSRTVHGTVQEDGTVVADGNP
jgi:flagella basal body P-ring formation protein FlgA